MDLVVQVDLRMTLNIVLIILIYQCGMYYVGIVCQVYTANCNPGSQ